MKTATAVPIRPRSQIQNLTVVDEAVEVMPAVVLKKNKEIS